MHYGGQEVFADSFLEEDHWEYVKKDGTMTDWGNRYIFFRPSCLLQKSH